MSSTSSSSSSSTTSSTSFEDEFIVVDEIVFAEEAELFSKSIQEGQMILISPDDKPHMVDIFDDKIVCETDLSCKDRIQDIRVESERELMTCKAENPYELTVQVKSTTNFNHLKGALFLEYELKHILTEQSLNEFFNYYTNHCAWLSEDWKSRPSYLISVSEFGDEVDPIKHIYKIHVTYFDVTSLFEAKFKIADKALNERQQQFLFSQFPSVFKSYSNKPRKRIESVLDTQTSLLHQQIEVLLSQIEKEGRYSKEKIDIYYLYITRIRNENPQSVPMITRDNIVTFVESKTHHSSFPE